MGSRKEWRAGTEGKVSVNKIRKGKAEGRLLEVLEPSASEIPSACPHFGQCGAVLIRIFRMKSSLP